MSRRKCRRKNGEHSEVSVCVGGGVGRGGGVTVGKKKVQHALIPIVNININLLKKIIKKLSTAVQQDSV